MAKRRATSIEEFIANLRLSGLIDELRLELLLYEFSNATDLPFGKSLTSFTSLVVGKNVLTAWQVAMLSENKFKGFSLGDYLLLDHVDSTLDSSRYLARNRVTQKLVHLIVSQRGSMINPLDQTRYDIKEI